MNRRKELAFLGELEGGKLDELTKVITLLRAGVPFQTYENNKYNRLGLVMNAAPLLPLGAPVVAKAKAGAKAKAKQGAGAIVAAQDTDSD